jgi:outer membrane protein
MNKKLMALAIAAVAASAGSQADIIGASAGVYHWKQSWDGDVQSGNDKIDVNDDLGYDEDSGTSYYVALEHPLPLLPNIRLQRTELEISERGTITTPVIYDGTALAGDVDSTTDLTHTDVTLYYELLDNWVNLDLGLSVRVFDGEARIKSVATSEEGSVDIDTPVPMLYANARFDLPFTGLYAQGIGNIISVGDSAITDFTVGLGYEVAVLSLEAGYRTFDISLEDDEDEANLTVDGFYIGINLDI